MNKTYFKVSDKIYIDMEKARPTKYIKRIPNPKGKGFIYFYNQAQIDKYKKTGETPKQEKGLFAGILSFFGLKDEKQAQDKIKAEYNQHKDKLSGISESDFGIHLNEYLSNKDKWDKKIKGEKAPKKTISVSKKTGKIVIKKEKKVTDGFKLSVMRTIAGIYGDQSEDKLSPMSEMPKGDETYLVKNSQGEEFKIKKVYPTAAEKSSPSGFNKNLWQSYLKQKGKSKWIKGPSGGKEAMFNFINDQATGHNAEIISAGEVKEEKKESAKKETSYKEKFDLETDIIEGKSVDKNIVDKYPEVKKKWGDSIKIKTDEMRKEEISEDKKPIVSSKEKKDIEKNEKDLNEKIKREETKNIPEQFKDKTPFETELIIVSRGRKYFKVTKPNSTFKMDLFINKSSENLKPGDKIQLNVLKNQETSQYGTKVQYYPISDENIVEIKEQVESIKTKKELNRWMGYVREAAEKGYIYQKGVDKLQNLGIEKIEDLNKELKEIKQTIQNEKTIQKINNYLGYMQEAADKGYVYRNGLQTLKDLKIENYPEKQEKLNKILDQVENKKQENIEKDKKEGRGFHVFTHELAPQLNVPVKKGDNIIVYENSGKTFRIDPEDEFTFGFNPGGGPAARYYYRKANENEIKQYNENQEKKEKQQKLRDDFQSAKNKIEKLINEKGEYIKPEKDLISLKGDEFFDTTNIYGGGSYILLDDKKEYIWHVKNNGMDGDDWSRNNIRTGGAGAIGYRLKYDDDIKNKFKKLLELNKIINGTTLEKASILLIDELQKAKAMPVGTVSKGRKKMPDGTWKPITEEKQPKEKPEKESKLGEKDKGTIKNALKKIANILTDALSGKDITQRTGETIEEAGESAMAKKSKDKDNKKS